jgi:hypothetical protein
MCCPKVAAKGRNPKLTLLNAFGIEDCEGCFDHKSENIRSVQRAPQTNQQFSLTVSVPVSFDSFGLLRKEQSRGVSRKTASAKGVA